MWFSWAMLVSGRVQKSTIFGTLSRVPWVTSAYTIYKFNIEVVLSIVGWWLMLMDSSFRYVPKVMISKSYRKQHVRWKMPFLLKRFLFRGHSVIFGGANWIVKLPIKTGLCWSWWGDEQPRLPFSTFSLLNNEQRVATGWGCLALSRKWS